MDVALSKLLVQRLSQRTQSGLPRRETRRHHVSSDARCSTREQESTTFTTVVDALFLELQNRLAGERVCALDGGFESRVDLIFCNIQEALEGPKGRVVKSDSYIGIWPVLFDALEGVGHVLIRVRFDGERSRLRDVSVMKLWDQQSQ